MPSHDPRRDRIPRWVLHGLAVLAAGGWLFALACAPSPSSPSSGSPITLTVGLPQSRQIDPSHGSLVTAGFLSNERLTGAAPDGRPSPRLVDSWSVSPDGLTWRLVLRSDVRFQDGSLLTSADVVRSISEALANPGMRDASVALGDIAWVTAENTRSVVIRLRRRCSYLLDDFDFSITRPGPNGTRIGTGPYRKVSQSGDEVLMEANREYYRGAPPVDRIVLRAYDTLRTAWAEMLRGRVDFLSEVGPDTVEFFQDQSQVRVHSFLSYYAYALTFNSARPVFRDRRVRQALSLAVDREEVLQLGLRGRGIPGDGPIWPRHWTHDASLPALVHSPDAAIALLDEAMGPAEPPGPGTRSRGPRVQFTCLLPLNFTIYERVALVVQKQLWDIDVDMRLEPVPVNAYVQRILSGDFDTVLLFLAGGPYLAMPYRLWHTPNPNHRWNTWGYGDAAVDAALESLRDAPDDAAIQAAARRFDLAQRDNPPALFLAWSETAQAISRRFDVPVEPGRDALSGLGRARPRRMEGFQ